MEVLQDKIVIITGCAQGIGKTIALQMAIEGAEVYALDQQKEKLDAWIHRCDSTCKDHIHAIALDLCNQKEVKDTILSIYQKHHKIDILVNNAGVIKNQSIGMILYDDMNQMMQVNVIALINMMQLVSRLMKRNHSGSIVNIASVTAVVGSPGQVAYSASKGAVISATKSAAKELAIDGIRVNAVAPGIIETERFDELYTSSASKIDARIAQIALGRLGTPQDIANACVFLASEQASYISGQILGVDGCATI